MTANGDYRDQRLTLHALLVTLGVQGVTGAAIAASCVAILTGSTPELEQEIVWFSGGCAQVNQVVFFLGTVPFGLFLMQSNRNARAFAAAADAGSGLLGGFTPASMIWWFFVPILNLVRPYQAVQAVWAASAPEDAGGEPPTQPGVITAWWTTWVVLSIWTRSTSVLTRQGSAPEAHNVVIAVSGAIGVAACLLALRMVRTLAERQARRALELWG